MSSKRKSATGDTKVNSSAAKKKKLPQKKNGGKKADEFSDDYDDSLDENQSGDEENDVEVFSDDDLNKDDGLRVPGPDVVGRLLICGAVNWDLYSRRAPPKGCKNTIAKNVFVPSRFEPLDNIKIRAVCSGSSAAHSVIISEDYKCYMLGRNERGQLGTGDTDTRFQPYLLESMSQHNIISASCGRNHTLLLSDRGIVYAIGDNKMGQCGVGNTQEKIMVPTRIRYRGPPIVKVVCGSDFSIILDLKGNLHSFGDPEYGQLGNGTNGEQLNGNKFGRKPEKVPKMIGNFIEKNKDSARPIEVADIIDVACGTNHGVALDSKRRLFSWGFGGYGRLGHAETKDEYFPRLVKFFDTVGKGIKAVYCGSQFSIAVSEHKMSYLFGKTKNTGEVNMYPKPLQDFNGWNVRSLGAGTTSVVVAADNTVIAFGVSPCYGELGLGEMRKSSSVPVEVKSLDGIYVEQVAMGQVHTLMVARETSQEDTDKINDLPTYDP